MNPFCISLYKSSTVISKIYVSSLMKDKIIIILLYAKLIKLNHASYDVPNSSRNLCKSFVKKQRVKRDFKLFSWVMSLIYDDSI